MRAKQILYFLLYWFLYSGLIKTYLFDNLLFVILPDLLLFYLAIDKKANYVRQVKKAVGSWVVGIFSVLLIGSTVVAFLNVMPIFATLWGLRMVVRYLLLFIITYKYFQAEDVVKIKKILISFFWINFGVVCFQYFIEGKYSDLIGGAFINNGELFVFTLLVSFLISKEFFIGHVPRKIFLLFIVALMFIAMAAEIKVIYFALPLVFYATYVFTKKISIKHLLILGIAYFSLVPAMKATISLMYGEDYVNNVFDVEAIQEETTHAYNLSSLDLSFNRSTCVEKATVLFLTEPFHLLFGYGIGSGNTSQLFNTWIGQTYSSTTSYNWFTSSWLLIEFGWVGFILWIVILLLLAKRFYSIYGRTNASGVKYWSSIGFLSVMFTFLIAWYNNTPYYNAYILYFFWALCFVGIREETRKFIENGGSRKHKV